MKEVKVKISSTVEGDKLEREVILECGAATLIEESVPKASTSLSLAITFAYLKLKHLYLEALSSDLTVVFNYAEGTKTITLAVGTPFTWTEGLGPVNPFTADVVSVAVTEDDVAAATLIGVLGVDLT